LTTAGELEVAIQELLDHGIKTIVHKQGAEESRYIARGSEFNHLEFAVPENDPTGAGDSFGATFKTHWLTNKNPIKCLKVVKATGALSVQQCGTMKGTSSFAEIQSLVNVHLI